VTPATLVVHWPGKDVPACIDHAEKLLGLALLMGFSVSTSAAPEGLTCTNCENEKAKRA
jgi:hypothetical protein